MKPITSRVVLVTAYSPGRFGAMKEIMTSWGIQATYDLMVYTESGYGVVPLFAEALEWALQESVAEILGCLHDDVIMEEDGWDRQVLDFFDRHPACGLLGFGGATGLGDPDIYLKPYDPMQLARRDFVSNMRHAEMHGRRARENTYSPNVRVAEPVACLDGFSLIGRREFWLGGECLRFHGIALPSTPYPAESNLLQRMACASVIHHAYDAALGCYAKRLGWEVWMLPVACHHLGGQTAVGDPAYAEWALTQDPEGDQGFWKSAHRWVYEEFRDVLPLQV